MKLDRMNRELLLRPKSLREETLRSLRKALFGVFTQWPLNSYKVLSDNSDPIGKFEAKAILNLEEGVKYKVRAISLLR
jgi:hypothetical protein